MRPMRSEFNEKEKKILLTIASEGPLNINNTRKKSTVAVTTTIDRLEALRKLGLVWVSFFDERPKGPIIHSLTPSGVVYSLKITKENTSSNIISLWENLTPRVLIQLNALSINQLDKILLEIFDYDSILRYSTSDVDNIRRFKHIHNPNLLQIQKHIFDMHYFNEVFKKGLYTNVSLVRMLKNDDEIMKSWKRFVAVEIFIHEHILKIMKDLEDQTSNTTTIHKES
jgi:hypothetical protein